LANRIVSIPMSLVGNAISQVFFTNAAQAHRDGKLGSLVAQSHATLAHIGFPPALLLVLLGPDIFGLAFGEKWLQAGEFARWMAPWLYLSFVSSPLSTIFAVTEKLRQMLTYQIVLLLARASAIAVGASQGDLKLTVMLFAGVSTLCMLGFLFLVANIAGNAISTILKPAISAGTYAALCATPVILVTASLRSYSHLWIYALGVSIVAILIRYWQLLRKTY
jgi:O-antigen/teichoic acid export membrane protein